MVPRTENMINIIKFFYYLRAVYIQDKIIRQKNSVWTKNLLMKAYKSLGELGGCRLRYMPLSYSFLLLILSYPLLWKQSVILANNSHNRYFILILKVQDF